MGIQLLFLRCYPRENDNRCLPDMGCQEVCVQGFSASPQVFFLHLGPGFSDTPAETGLLFAPWPQLVFIKRYTGGLSGALHIHTSQKDMFAVSSIRKTLTEQISHGSVLLLSVLGQWSVLGLSWGQSESWGQTGKRSAWVCPLSSLWPSSWVLLGQARDSPWSPDHHPFAARQLGRAPVEWGITTHSPWLELLSPHPLGKEVIVINAINLNTNYVNCFFCLGQLCPKFDFTWNHENN